MEYNKLNDAIKNAAKIINIIEALEYVKECFNEESDGTIQYGDCEMMEEKYGITDATIYEGDNLDTVFEDLTIELQRAIEEINRLPK